MRRSRVDVARQDVGLDLVAGDSFLVDESMWEGTAPGTPFGLPGRGRPLEFRLLHVIDFTESGDIQKEQVWIDLAAVMAQLSAD